MITCQKCGKENQDHYKFCLGCGAELTREAAAPLAPTPGFSSGGVIVGSSGGPEPSLTAQPGGSTVPVQRAIDATHASPGVAPPGQISPTGDGDTADGSSVSVVSVASKGDAAKNEAPAAAAGASPEGNAEPASPASPDAASPNAAQPSHGGSLGGSSQGSGSLGGSGKEEPSVIINGQSSSDSAGGTGAAGTADTLNLTCPQCSRNNADGNRFCASCGYKLNMSSLPARPAGEAPEGSVGRGEISLTALRADGTEAGSFTLPSGPSETVGRDTGAIFAGDSYLSPRHATFVRKGDRLLVNDAGSLNGVYFKISPNTPWTLRFGDVFRIGQEILRLEKLEGPSPSPDGVRRLGSPADGYVARLGLVIGRDTTGNAFPVPKAGLHLGRERGDVLFPEDGYVSGLHCRLAVGTDGTITLTDLGSSNGSFVRLKDEHPVSGGDILLMGQQLFRINA